jgi:hypothetical protein
MSETLTKPVLQKFKNRIFVETGTYKGGGIQLALDLGFEEVRSIEFLLDRFQNVKKRFVGDNRVKLYQGDSAKRLAEMIADIEEPITFWLDGHSVEVCPAWDELKIIAQHPVKTHTILIDDLHYWKNWKLDEQEVRKFLLELNPNYVFSYEPNWVKPDDIFVASLTK